MLFQISSFQLYFVGKLMSLKGLERKQLDIFTFFEDVLPFVQDAS